MSYGLKRGTPEAAVPTARRSTVATGGRWDVLSQVVGEIGQRSEPGLDGIGQEAPEVGTDAHRDGLLGAHVNHGQLFRRGRQSIVDLRNTSPDGIE